jgi:hypothetical protein
MKIGVLGTGMVGEAIASRLVALESTGAGKLAGNVLVDVANPLDFSTPTFNIAVVA